MSKGTSGWSRRETLSLGAVLALLPPAQAGSQHMGDQTMTDTATGVHDFDFLFGSWRVSHRKLKKRLANSSEWLEFTGQCIAQPIMAGTGNVDDNFLDDPKGGYRAAALRHFNPSKQEWSIWWFDERYPDVSIDPPVRGRFENGVGIFLADDTLEGKPIKVRFQWSEITATSARWQQAFSPDGGKNWETNWDMHFEREA